MTVPPPKIDERSYSDIVEQTVTLVQQAKQAVQPTLEQLRSRTLAETIRTPAGDEIAAAGQHLVPAGEGMDALQEFQALIQQIAAAKQGQAVNVKLWQPGKQTDAGLALIRLFSRLAQLVSDRVNQVPDKYFLAFLNLIGTRITPPQPARVPLTFSLVDNSPEDALVPAGTQIAAPETEANPEAVFELEQDLVVVRSRLIAVVTPPDSDHTSIATGEGDETFAPFQADDDAAHVLYLGFDRPFPNRSVAIYIQVAPLEPGELAHQVTQLRQAAVSGSSTLAVESIWGLRPGQYVRLAPGSEFQEDVQINAVQPDDASASRRSSTGTLVLEQDAPAVLLKHDHPVKTRIVRIAPRPKLVWEYYATGGWQPLGVTDETAGLTERGLVRFIGPANWQAHTPEHTSTHCYWLRVRWVRGDYLVMPRLQQILTNTAWASAVVTTTNEVLGSSTGNPNQRFVANQVPVLPEQQLEVREVLSPADYADLTAVNPSQLTPAETSRGGQTAHWVHWQEVVDLYASQPRDRHYCLNRLTGEITFGDGFQGLIPPLGQGNIRLSRYQTGGGLQGNCPSGTIQQLRTTVPFVAGVTNYEPAGGGAAQEPLNRVQERGPKRLRHRDRAVTVQDIEDLAFEASPEVARAHAIAPEYAADLESLPVFHIPIEETSLTLTLTWQEQQVETLTVRLYGPGQSAPWHEQTLAKSPTADTGMTITLPEEPRLKFGESQATWRLVLSNAAAVNATGIAGSLSYGTSEQVIEVANLSPTPHRQASLTAGRVDVVIVPHTLGLRPTPSLGLVHQVETYLQARCSPTMALRVTEPHWVEVTVEATLVPTTVQAADSIRIQAQQLLAQFLHPLTGGADGRGWSFDRRPHASDIYAVLARVDGVDHIAELNVTPTPQTSRPDHFLIYSGAHTLILG